MKKKTLGILALVSFLVFPYLALSLSFCEEARRASCQEIAKFSEKLSLIKSKCGDFVFQQFSQKVKKCKEEIEKEKERKKKKLEEIKEKESAVDRTLKVLDLNIRELNAEIASLNFSIASLEEKIKKLKENIESLDKKLSYQKKTLAFIVRQLYEYDAISWLEIFLGQIKLSDLSQKVEEIQALQKSLFKTIEGIKKVKNIREKEKKTLEKKLKEKLEYKKIQEVSRQSLILRQREQKILLEKLSAARTPLEREMARIEAELSQLRIAMQAIQRYLTSWLGYQPTWAEIFAVVEEVSKITGVRPALLLAVLQMESRFKTSAGFNAGSPEGNLKRCLDFRIDDSLCYREKPVFEEICQELGLDKNKVPISPTYAMGPAQVIPTTWRGYQRLYPSLKNPWSLHDAVLLMGYILARNGAASGNERKALYVYNRSSSYVNDVLYTANYGWQPVLDVCGFDLNCPQMRQRLEEKFGEIPIE